ncbi:MAG: DMT family transporter, partial [Pygmaiobacter sp.]
GFGLGGSDPMRGLLCGLAAAVFYGALMLMGKFVHDLSGLETTLVRLLGAAVVMAVYAPLTHTGAWVLPSGRGLAALLLVGVVHTGIACALFFSAIAELPAQTSALLSYLDPASALLFSALVLGERLTVVQLVGAALILGGAAFGELYHGSSKPRNKQNETL